MRSLLSHESPSLARERGLAVPVSPRVAALRAALERVLDTPVQVLAEDGRTRIQASAPDRRDIATWEAVLAVLRSVDRWGSTDSGQGPRIWAEVNEGGAVNTTATADETRRQVLTALPLPALDGLTEQQVRGLVCVWDAVPLTPDIAVDLGPRKKKRLGVTYDWFPRGCRRCVAAHAYRALLEHVGPCRDCGPDKACAQALALSALSSKGAR